MIIKGIFRRYERWNPVHPTYGAFWGMGIGIGCGVGWGPGFGPEVIGYVGSGCGIGFHVGVTLAGIGIGLPTNCIYTVPYNAIMQARTGSFDLAQPGGLLSSKRVAEGAINNFGHFISDMQTDAMGRLSGLQQKCLLNKRAGECDGKSLLPNHAINFLDSLGKFVGCIWRPPRGSKD